jgi:hypothetical protein
LRPGNGCACQMGPMAAKSRPRALCSSSTRSGTNGLQVSVPLVLSIRRCSRGWTRWILERTRGSARRSAGDTAMLDPSGRCPRHPCRPRSRRRHTLAEASRSSSPASGGTVQAATRCRCLSKPDVSRRREGDRRDGQMMSDWHPARAHARTPGAALLALSPSATHARF